MHRTWPSLWVHLASNDLSGELTFIDVQVLCGGWPYTADSHPEYTIDSAMALVTSDFDLKYETCSFSNYSHVLTKMLKLPD